MISIHKEGQGIVNITISLVLFLAVLTFFTVETTWLKCFIYADLLLLGAFVTYFFRNPKRKPVPNDELVYSPADGKVVVVEKVFDRSYFNEERIQISIFLSVFNVHINYLPVTGEIEHMKYYPGEYLVAWHPKSSEKNERSVVVVKNKKASIYVKQIAGLIARRIITYGKVGDQISQGDEMGFIRFGSRVDLLLPLDTKIDVKVGDMVTGNKSVIAHL